MTWLALLRERVSEHARRAAPDALERIAAGLPGAPGASIEPLAERLFELEAEATLVVEGARDRAERLRAAPPGMSRRVVLERVLDDTGDRGDRAALDRWLDAEAIADRDRFRLHRSWQARQLLAEVLATCLWDGWRWGTVGPDLADRLAVWVREAGRPWLLRAAYVGALAALVQRVPHAGGAQAVRELAVSAAGSVWVQVAALEAYARLRPDAARPLVRTVLAPDAEQGAYLPDDHRFVRGRAAALAGRLGDVDALRQGLQDDSELVRQAVIRALVQAAPVEARRWLDARREPSWRVRAVGWLAQLPDPGEGVEGWAEALVAPLGEEEPEVRAVLVRALLDRRRALRAHPGWAVPLDALAEHPDVDLAESAALLGRWVRIEADPTARAALEALDLWLDNASSGDRRTFGPPVSELAPEPLLDVLCVAAADRHDLSADPVRTGVRVVCGAQRVLAPWRLLHELRSPAPDKRQAHDHVGDELLPGAVQAPSRRLAEVTPTRVPGMRVATTETLDWGSHLPLPAQLVAATRRQCTEVVTPRHHLTLVREVPRWRAWWRTQRRYLALDATRRSQAGRGADGVAVYDREVAELGFRIVRHPQSAPWPEAVALIGEAIRTDSNTLGDLAVVAGAMLGGWTLRNLLVNRAVRRHRAAIPLVVGGWGSRGKSGTERLKAALFHGLGYRVVAKTTGCEAMFIASVPGADPVEVFLFRPFDKATIVEQRDVLRLAAELGAQVMTWECMALRPGFVDILQRQWMRDDLSTVTNTYPDHEDIQGPSGADVARTIAGFLPRGAVAFGTEQHMTPVLDDEARRVGTDLRAVRPERWRLLPEDALDRFPYAAHPRNVALVLAMAEHLGVPADLALHRMADCVVPDLGVLKEYGPARYRERTVTFVNGCSANERAGFLSNWRRMGLDAVGPDTGLSERLAIVFNNRADRLARQKVFARIAVHDASADAMVVIGTNVGAFASDVRAFLRDELRPDLIRLGRDASRDEWLHRIRHHLRRPSLSPEEALERAVAFVGAEHGPSLRSAAAGPLVTVRPAEGEVHAVRAAAQWVREVCWLYAVEREDAPDIESRVDELLALLEARLVPLEDPGLTGDQVLHRVALTAPDGSVLRILGAENIKGTGLDFVYRWISLQKSLGRLDALRGAEHAADARRTLAALREHADWGLIDLELAVGVLAELTEEGTLRLLGVHDEARALHDELAARAEARAARLSVGRRPGWRDRLVAALEAWLDPLDSVFRRRKTLALYRDLGARRVGTRRAAAVAKELTSRQKGGWLGRSGSAKG